MAPDEDDDRRDVDIIWPPLRRRLLRACAPRREQRFRAPARRHAAPDTASASAKLFHLKRMQVLRQYHYCVDIITIGSRSPPRQQEDVAGSLSEHAPRRSKADVARRGNISRFAGCLRERPEEARRCYLPHASLDAICSAARYGHYHRHFSSMLKSTIRPFLPPMKVTLLFECHDYLAVLCARRLPTPDFSRPTARCDAPMGALADSATNFMQKNLHNTAATPRVTIMRR